jgi:hypothetical protein
MAQGYADAAASSAAPVYVDFSGVNVTARHDRHAHRTGRPRALGSALVGALLRIRCAAAQLICRGVETNLHGYSKPPE